MSERSYWGGFEAVRLVAARQTLRATNSTTNSIAKMKKKMRLMVKAKLMLV